MPNGIMSYGMLCGKRFMTSYGKLECFICIYKLHEKNFSDFEKEYKKTVQKEYDSHFKKLNARRSFKRLGAKDMEVGCVYVSMDGKAYIYYGHGTVTTLFNNTETVATGYIYMRVGDCEFSDKTSFEIADEYVNKYILDDMFFSSRPCTPTVNKTMKKFVAKTSYKSVILNKNFEYSYRDEYNKYNCQFPNDLDKMNIHFVLD